MNQVKTGRFIAEMRKQQNLTQREFADILGISDKTVSKWECGNGMPELSLMQPVCKVLKTDLNELFSGERLTDADYKKESRGKYDGACKRSGDNEKEHCRRQGFR